MTPRRPAREPEPRYGLPSGLISRGPASSLTGGAREADRSRRSRSRSRERLPNPDRALGGPASVFSRLYAADQKGGSIEERHQWRPERPVGGGEAFRMPSRDARAGELDGRLGLKTDRPQQTSRPEYGFSSRNDSRALPGDWGSERPVVGGEPRGAGDDGGRWIPQNDGRFGFGDGFERKKLPKNEVGGSRLDPLYRNNDQKLGLEGCSLRCSGELFSCTNIQKLSRIILDLHHVHLKPDWITLQEPSRLKVHLRSESRGAVLLKGRS